MQDGLYYDTNGFYQVEQNEVELYFPEVWPMVDSIVEVGKDSLGRMKKWVETIRVKECLGHPQSGQQLSKKQDDYTYYETGELDLIDQKELDGNDDIEHQREIKHYKDGRQPKVKIIK